MPSPDTPARSRRRRTLIAALPILLLALAWVLMVEAPSADETSHYALIRSLAAGTAKIDRYAGQTIDKSFFAGHYYSNKAPGMGLLGAPVYLVLDKTGLAAAARRAATHLASSSGVSAKTGAEAQIRADRGIIWVLTLWEVTLPALILLLLARAVAERIEPGYGTVAAVALGAGTLLLPFSALLFSHVLSATLGFAAFALLFLPRAGRERHLVASGLLAGLAVTTEYPLAIVAVLLGLYVLLSRRSLRGLVLFGAGGLIGLVPLGLYDLLAFGSITHLSYVGALPTTSSGISPHHSGLYGVGVPNLGRGLAVLLAPKGLLTLTPLAGLAAAALALSRQAGHRREAILAGVVGLAFLIYNAGYFGPLGGQTPGPRFMIATLPFLVIGLAPAFRRWPGPTCALLGASVATMLLATLTQPQLAGSDLAAWTSLARAGNLQYTLLGALGLGHGWGPALPVLALVVGALAVALSQAGVHLGARDVLAGAVVLAGWLGLVLVSASIRPGNALPAGLVGVAGALALLAAVHVTPASRALGSAAAADP